MANYQIGLNTGFAMDKKLTPGQPDDQDVTMLHCAETRWTGFLRSTIIAARGSKGNTDLVASPVRDVKWIGTSATHSTGAK